jgi:hypothetical protein
MTHLLPMKNLVFALCMFCGFSAGAQQYVPMPDTNAVWKEWWCFLISPPEIKHTDHYVEGDTVINGQSYTNIYSDGQYHSTWTHTYEGAMRNDTAARHVYFVPRNYTTEVLLYDFNLVVGQVFPMTWFNRNNYQPDTVVTIDSVWVGTSWRKRYISSSGQYEIVEGMGSVGGLFEPHLTVGATFTELRCFYQNDRPAWPDTASGCVTPVGMNENAQLAGMNIFPSPASTELNISFTQLPQQDIDILLLTLDGRTVKQQRMRANATCVLNVADVAAGVYLVVVREPDCADRVQRVMIE